MRNLAGLACIYQNIGGTDLPDQQYWHTGSGDAPILGDFVYSDSSATTVLPLGFYQLLREYILIQVDGTGEVILVTNCS
jgi:hypothetical protein